MKKVLSLLLAIIMVASVCMASFITTAGSAETVNGYSCGVNYYYKDSYFASNASEYNPSLSTMSYVLARASFPCGDWSYQYQDLYNLLNNLGFVDFDVNEYYKKYPEIDSMGVGIAHKTITVSGKTYTLLAIAPRSCNYEAEWASNFTIGASGDAQGFSNSATIVEAFVNEYVAKYGSRFTGEIKLWIAGYSRGAAVSNLVAGRITKAGKIGKFSVAKENIYAYTFETPAGLSTETVSIAEAKTYTNIHNIITANDLVTKVAPTKWGFIRYGVDESIIPETRTADNSSLFDFAVQYLPERLAAYDSNGKRIFASETFQAKKLSTKLSDLKNKNYTVNSDKTMSEFLNDLVSALALGIGSRQQYTYEVQDLIRLIISELLGSNYQTERLTLAKAALEKELTANRDSIVNAAVRGNVSELEDILETISQNVLDASDLDAEAYAKVPAQISLLIPIVAKAVVADALIDGGSDIITLIDNISIVGNPHEPDQCVAWLRAFDPNYNPTIKQANAKVTDVKVTVTKKTETKKVLFVKTTTTKYDVQITPISGDAVKSVSYRTALIGSLKSGNSFTKDLNPSYIYISVTDACGNVTHWEYKNGSVKQVK